MSPARLLCLLTLTSELAHENWQTVTDNPEVRWATAVTSELLGALLTGNGGRADVVEGKPKSRKSIREVDLSPDTVAVLRRWRETQQLEGQFAGEAYEASGYVFVDELGRPLHPDVISNRFETTSGLPRLHFHGLRHTAATLAIDAKVPIHVVSAILGHASVAITADVYRHRLKKQHADAAESIGNHLFLTRPEPEDEG